MVFAVNEDTMIEHTIKNNEIYAVVNKDVINKKREKREKECQGDSYYLDNEEPIYAEVGNTCTTAEQTEENLYDAVDTNCSKEDNAGYMSPEECGCPNGIESDESKKSTDRHSSKLRQKSASIGKVFIFVLP